MIGIKADRKWKSGRDKDWTSWNGKANRKLFKPIGPPRPTD